MSIGKTAALLLASALIDVAGARLLDSLGLIEGILSPAGASLAILVPAAALFFAARLCCYFVAPGLLLGALVEFAFPRWLARPQLTQAVPACAPRTPPSNAKSSCAE